MSEIAKIQEIINSNADAILQKEIENISNTLSGAWKLLGDIYINAGTAEQPKRIQLTQLLYPGNNIYEQLIAEHQKSYRGIETKNFVEKVNGIQEDIKRLLESTQEKDY